MLAIMPALVLGVARLQLVSGSQSGVEIRFGVSVRVAVGVRVKVRVRARRFCVSGRLRAGRQGQW